MSVDNPSVGDATNETSGQPSNKDSVAYDTYRKVLGEAKSLKAKLAEYETKEAEREQSILAEQGKLKEALDLSIKKQKELEANLSAKDKAFAKKVFTKEVESVALQLGARKEALEDIVKVGDWSSVEIDEDFTINQEQLKASLANLAKSKPFYFVGNPKAPSDVSTAANGAPKGKALNELTKEDILAQLKNLK
ncbi:MAG TPA: hypothetical protein PK522_00915 [Nitrosomonas sp.]|nr:hypothetical protein [Nitrosomonas sp.]